MLQPGGKVTLKQTSFLIEGARSRLFGKVLSPAGAGITIGKGVGEHINVDDPLSLRISAPEPARQIEFLVVMAPLGEREKEPEIGKSGQAIHVGRQTITFAEDGRAAPRLLDRTNHTVTRAGEGGRPLRDAR